MVKDFGPAIHRQKDDAVLSTYQTRDLGLKVHTFVWKVGQNSVNILLRATRDGHPRSTSTGRIEKIVIPQEPHKCNGRKVERAFVWAHTPYRCCHWNEVVVLESLRISFSVKVLPY